ncbi:MAG: ATP synthase subunit I [Deltaproteobacteria bacterium]|nr:ATP synthase subunit I [Deltaproteobacteria bacterium]
MNWVKRGFRAARGQFDDDQNTEPAESPRALTEAEAEVAQNAIKRIMLKVLPVNLAAALVLGIILSRINPEFLNGFIIGSVIGLFTQVYGLGVVRRSLRKQPERIMGFVLLRYYGRFAATILTMAALIVLAKINPWGLIIGYGLLHIITTLTMMVVAKKQQNY